MANAQDIFGFSFELPRVGLGNVSNVSNAQSVYLQSTSGFQHTLETFRPDRHWPSTQLGTLSADLQVESFQPMDVDVVSDADQASIYDPLRLVANAAQLPPPKRFHRTFWRSAARRVLKLQAQSSNGTS